MALAAYKSRTLVLSFEAQKQSVQVYFDENDLFAFYTSSLALSPLAMNGVVENWTALEPWVSPVPYGPYDLPL